MDELTETVCDYVNFCVDSIISKKTISIFPNNKPWVTKTAKNTLKQRNTYFIKGDTEKYKELQKQVKHELQMAKHNYKVRLENLLSSGSSRPAWEGVKSIMGLQSKKHHVSLRGRSDLDLANELNVFSNRFNVYDFSND